MSNLGKLTVSIENRLENLAIVCDQIEEFAQINLLSTEDRFALILCMDELVSNIISYGYAEPGAHAIEICVEASAAFIALQISDDGFPFNPLSDAPPPDLDSATHERRMGGLGLHMVKAAMDSLSYCRENGFNILKLTRKCRDEGGSL